MLWTGKQITDIIEAATDLVERLVRAPIREHLKDAAFAYREPDDAEFLAAWQKRAADPAWVLMLALDDGPHGMDWLRRYRELTGIDPLMPLLAVLPPEQQVKVLEATTSSKELS